jgi:hypothetical protein
MMFFASIAALAALGAIGGMTQRRRAPDEGAPDYGEASPRSIGQG